MLKVTINLKNAEEFKVFRKIISKLHTELAVMPVEVKRAKRTYRIGNNLVNSIMNVLKEYNGISAKRVAEILQENHSTVAATLSSLFYAKKVDREEVSMSARTSEDQSRYDYRLKKGK